VTNGFTPTWFATYLKTYAEEVTEAELAFIARQLPLPAYRTVLDLCCGNGRLSIPLAARGYEVTGLERDAAMVAEARARAGGSVSARFIQADMRDLAGVPGQLDAVINMWHSFGYFDAATNEAVLRQIHGKLNPRGRCILDVYNRRWFDQHQGTETAERDGRRITTTRSMHDGRLAVQIDYGSDVPADTFDWQLYTADELATLAGRIGLRTLARCTWADESRPITPADARMQLVFEKDGA
jgi:SAM-dependent methyltransferase